MGSPGTMNWLTTILLLAMVFVAVFWEAAFSGVRYMLGAQIDLLPPLMVYAALCTGLITVCLISFLGGLWFDALSANPLGISILPLFAIGLAIYIIRELVLRDQIFAQFVLGLIASAVAPVLTLVLLLTLGHTPMFGWGTIWQLAIMSAGGALATPVFFVLFDWLHRMLAHARNIESSFRPDREIRRGR